jgi:hypothetical protein
MDTLYNIINFEQKLKPNYYPNMIHDNFSIMTNEEKINYLKCCMTQKEIDKILLTIDLNYYHPIKKIVSKYQFIKNVKKLLIHYLILEKDMFEDTQWILYEPDNEIYELHINEVVLENTMPFVDCYNKTIINFMEQIIRQCNEMSNFKTNYKILSDKEYNICRVIFIIQF